MLAPFTDYVWSVAAATAVGFGPYSEYHQTQTDEDGVLFTPFIVLVYEYAWGT